MLRTWNMMGLVIEGRPAGKKQVDLPWPFDTLKASRYDFNMIIELWPPLPLASGLRIGLRTFDENGIVELE